MDNEKWKEKFSDFITTCQGELRKTTEIGKKMLSASRINTELHETFEALGKHAREQIREQKLQWSDNRVDQLLKKIETCERGLKEFEDGVKDIKDQEKTEEKS